MTDFTPINTLWILLCSGLVAFMQAGFLCLETGLTRSKNNINVAVKNVADFGISALCFGFVGYTLMFGQGHDLILSSTNQSGALTFFFFQLMFCGTAVTIISGGAAERLRFSAYVAIAIVVSSLIYPIFGRWAWMGVHMNMDGGWLAALGFVDFAGATVVHTIGGACCLAILLIIGPRAGRFTSDGKTNRITGSNIPLAALGTMLLWIGWFGFNGGSVLALNNQVPLVLTNTTLSGAAGLISITLVSQFQRGKIDVVTFLNGPLAGLVAITGFAHAASPLMAFVVGLIGGLVAYFTTILLLMNKVDDAVGAIPVHLATGVWGTIAVGLFGDLSILGTGLDRLTQIGVQSFGALIAVGWGFGATYIVFSIINKLSPLRVSAEAEYIGLNIHEHDAHTDLLDMFLVMDEQAKTKDLSLRVPEEPFTEVGRIAKKYNQVISNLEQATARIESVINSAQDGIITFAPGSWMIQSANPAAAYILKTTPEELKQQRLTDFLAEAIPNPRALMSTDVYQFNRISGRRANGQQFPLEIAVNEVHTKDTFFYTALFRDITERQTFISELAEARDEALQAAQLKDQLLAMVGHELRTPIMAIYGSAELVEAEVLGEINEDQKRFLSQIIDSSIHLDTLVNDLIEQSNLESGRIALNIHSIDTNAFVEHVKYPIQRLARDKGLAFQFHLDKSMPQEIHNDSTRLKQIITNLGVNSTKFTKKGKIDITLLSNQDSHWSIIVQDTGIGIPIEKQSSIFDPFIQVDSVTTRELGGIGLGLAIVNQLVSLMRGDIQLQSIEGEGTTIQIDIPFLQTTS